MDRYEFIWKAIQKHGYRYDYSKVEYKNNKIKVCIICPIHGEFWQKPNHHLSGQGCKHCFGERRKENKKLTTEEFIEKAKQVHGDKYDYSKVNYVRSTEKICINCPKHGEFWQIPSSHLMGVKCPQCAIEIRANKRSLTLNEFIEKARKIHGDKYDYSKSIYENGKSNVCIICPVHGEFYQRAEGHLYGKGCSKCSGTKKLNNKEFIEKARKVHSDKYDYSKVEYKGNKIPVCIICPVHGEFWQTPNDHISKKCGCLNCNESHLEKEVNNFLLKNDIIFERQKRFKWLGKQSLDFYLPDYNIAIECQGIQHFKPVDIFGGIKGFEKTIERDVIKAKLCDNNDVHLIYFNYNDNIEEIMDKINK